MFHVPLQQEEWTNHNNNLVKFIRTKTRPHIFYRPGKMCSASQKLLDDSTKKLNGQRDLFEVGAELCAVQFRPVKSDVRLSFDSCV